MRTLYSLIISASALIAASTYAAAPATVEMKSLSYSPKLIQIKTGQSVLWKNTSLTKHSATSYDDGKTFDTGLIDPGKETKAITFNQAGTFQYHCSLHGKTMSGEIIVTAGRVPGSEAQ